MFAGNRASRTLLSAAICLIAPVWLHARITKITIVSRAPAFNGQAMGPYGAYEKVKGIAQGEVELKRRATGERQTLSLEAALKALTA